MANPNSPFGLSPVADAYGRPWNGPCTVMTTTSGDGTAIGIGDPVLALGTSTTNADGTVTKDVKIAATTDVFEGVVVAVLPDVATSTLYRVASTVRRLLVCTDPNALFEIQEVSGGTPLTADDIGLNASITIGSPSTVTGKSGATLNNATEAVGNTLALKIIGKSSRLGNDIGDSCVWLVRINRHRLVDQVAGL